MHYLLGRTDGGFLGEEATVQAVPYTHGAALAFERALALAIFCTEAAHASVLADAKDAIVDLDAGPVAWAVFVFFAKPCEADAIFVGNIAVVAHCANHTRGAITALGTTGEAVALCGLIFIFDADLRLLAAIIAVL